MNRFVLVLVVLLLEAKSPNREGGREGRRGKTVWRWENDPFAYV